MNLALQFGNGMKALSENLVRRWGGGSVIMSPRDADPDKIIKWSNSIQDEGGRILVDPQCYFRTTDHECLKSHAHIGEYLSMATGSFSGPLSPIDRVLEMIEKHLVEPINLQDVVLPCRYGMNGDSSFLEFISQTAAHGRKRFAGLNLIQSVAIDHEFARNEVEMEALLERLANLGIEEFYLMAEPTDGYILSDPVWMANMMNLIAGLKLLGKRIILGYANHQYLPFACCGVDEIATGTHRNVRMFSDSKFHEQDEIRRNAVWYFCPSALSEYKIDFLDIAKQQGVLGDLQTKPPFSDEICGVLFAGAQPSSVDWGLKNAFPHYLINMQLLCSEFSRADFQSCFDYSNQFLDQAKRVANGLEAKGVRSGDRSITDAYEAIKSGLAVLNSSRGAQLRRSWPS